MKRLIYILLFIFLPWVGIAQSQPVKNATNVRITKVYPNPANSYISFELSDKVPIRDFKLVIYSFIGKRVMDVPVNDRKISVPLKDVYRGLYIFQLFDNRGHIVESGKFQVAN